MSINTMANVAVAKHAARAGRVPATPGTAPSMSAGTAAPPSAAAQASSALSAITTHIPTEILTLYVAIRSALAPAAGVWAKAGDNPSEWFAFWLMFVATPVVVWIVFATKLRAARQNLPLAPRVWPIWEMFAALVAYVAWAFALPNSPFDKFAFYSSAMASVVVLVTSMGLGLLAPLLSKSR